MNGDDSQAFIGGGDASDLRETQLLMVNEDRGVSTRVTAYAPPTREWLASVVAAALSE
jgi:hypothetical protein